MRLLKTRFCGLEIKSRIKITRLKLRIYTLRVMIVTTVNKVNLEVVVLKPSLFDHTIPRGEVHVVV